ncbi:hypothetical protein FRC11_013670 [Ceratobasidium sp. 423]|nr:hypothetical protein FRC11_013670 [Ceratobasidium sp. 423]
MNDYSSLFTSGLMLLCDSAHTRNRHTSVEKSPADDKNTAPGLCSFLSLDMAESLRTFATGTPSNPPSRAHSRKPSSERRIRATYTPVASSSKHVPKAPVSPASFRRRSLPEPKPAPLAELPVVPTQTHSRSRSDSAASQAFPALSVISAPKSDMASFILPDTATNGKSKGHLAPSCLKLELSSAPTTPCSPFPTTPRSSQAISMFSPLTPPTADSPWFPTIDIASDTWSDPFAGALSPTTTESALGLHPPRTLPVIDLENIAPGYAAHNERPIGMKRARARRTRHSAPSRNTSIAANSMRSSQGSVTTTYRKTQRNGALARLEGRDLVPRSEWMSDDEDASTKFRGLSLMPSMTFNPESDHINPLSLRERLAPYKSEDLNRSFIDLTDDVASLASRQPVP